ncbi:hypothetical protein BU23DRAFT_148135 [Bimuria novae-zelandiae CBS 107.79]|uniref:Uncharacterized protein n=1 Tax=Bimuria novae-zelandiae CBS 107.79 TaxID=1447943 RepID=A0A6A5VQ72_9PLEO|nr:hypothetical protein BU23DRAFT_148135 [Bimuria novae-zelandiae CBS 107.79]
MKMPTLPAELVEEILTALVDSYNDDPAYQWNQLRNLSSFQRQCIEKHFENFWLPKLIISAFSGIWFSWEYTLDSTDALLSEGIATYRHILDPSNSMNHLLQEKWEYPSGPAVFLRFGEGFLKRGLRGGYIVDDLEPTGLEVSNEGLTMRFNWRRTLDALFREEMLLRNHREAMLQSAEQDFAQLHDMQNDPEAKNKYLLKRLCQDIQMASRVAVLRHRHAQADPSGQSVPIFSRFCRRFHLQEPNDPRDSISISCGDRCTPPSIFEIVQQEESMVLCLPGWHNMSNQMLYDLYAEEFGWACCIVQGRRDDEDFQKERRRVWDNPIRFEVSDMLICRHYDPLG